MPDLFAMPEEDRWQISPSEFAFLHLGMDLYPWQQDVVDSVGRQEPVALAAANESGKTTFCVAPIVLWFLWRFPMGRCVITSGAFRQVKDQLWPAMEIFRDKFPGWDWMSCEIRTNGGGKAVGFTVTDAGKFEGWHPRKSAKVDPVMIIVDEAKTVKDPIFAAVDRCGPQYQMFVSSPGLCTGQFYRCFKKEREFYKGSRIRSEDCSHISDLKRRRDLAKYGEDSPVYRSMHLAEFAEDEGSLILTSQKLERGLAAQPEIDASGERVGFCDFGMGVDENVFAARKGNAVRIIDTWVDADTNRAAARFIALFRDQGLHPGQVWGDADGLGGPIVSNFSALGFTLIPYHGNARAPDPDNYQNLLTYVWERGCHAIAHGQINVGALDDRTFEQLTSRPWQHPGGWGPNGKLQAMPKIRMKKEFGIESPDRADAILGAIICGRRLSGAVGADTVKMSVMKPSPFRVETIHKF